MTDITTNLSLRLLYSGQSQKDVTVNEALAAIDAVLNRGAEDKDLTAPPASPATGALYIVGSGATGAWSGHDRHISWFEQVWRFLVPNEGMTLWVNDENALYAFNGTAWVITGSGESTPLLGVNATADTTNRLTVQSSAVLFNHDGSNSYVKVNKAAAVNTASHLFQSNFSGRAEFGLIGNDNFKIKVSSNGSTWADALTIDKSTAAMTPGNASGTRIGFNVLRGVVQPETQALIEAMTTVPKRSRTFLIDDAVTALKEGGIWSKLDVLYVLAAHDSQAARVNWVGPGNFTLVEHDTLVFAANVGYTGSAGYLSSGFIPATHATKATVSSACGGVWTGTINAGAVSDFCSTDTSRFNIRLRTGTDIVQVNGSQTFGAGAVSESSGHLAANISGSDFTYYLNGAVGGTATSAPLALATGELALFSIGNNNFSGRQVKLAYFGSALTSGEAAAAHSIFNTYFTGLS